MDKATLPSDIIIRNELKPGDIGSITYLHGTLYAAEQGWDHTFEAYVAGPLSEFAKSQTARERIWIVERAGAVAGSIAIVEVSEDEAQLRWLLLHNDLRGFGIGRMLVEEAVAFCRTCNYSRVFLTTVSALLPAARIYQLAGFQLMQEQPSQLWGASVIEQRYDLLL